MDRALQIDEHKVKVLARSASELARLLPESDARAREFSYIHAGQIRQDRIGHNEVPENLYFWHVSDLGKLTLQRPRFLLIREITNL